MEDPQEKAARIVPADNVKWPNIFKKFLPVFLLAAILPLLLIGAVRTSRYNFLSRAESRVLRLWFEPATVVTSPNAVVTLQLIAEFDISNTPIPSLTATLEADSSLIVDPINISYQKQFRGRTKIADIQVRANSAGSFTINIPQSSVNTTLSPLTVMTSPATIFVKNDL